MVVFCLCLKTGPIFLFEIAPSTSINPKYKELYSLSRAKPQIDLIKQYVLCFASVSRYCNIKMWNQLRHGVSQIFEVFYLLGSFCSDGLYPQTIYILGWSLSPNSEQEKACVLFKVLHRMLMFCFFLWLSSE